MEEGSVKRKDDFHELLRCKMDDYVHLVYRITRKFPREEMYSSGSQLRRAALSVILNYVEGYARARTKVHKNFLEISYGSLKESRYLVGFALREVYITEDDFRLADVLANDIGAMLWGVIRRL